MTNFTRTLLALALCLGLAATAGTASAAAITSSDFSFGYDKTALTTWTLVSPSTPTTQGDFTFTPTVGGDDRFSQWGPVFTSRTLVSGYQGASCGRTTDFSVSIDASYTGAQPVSDITLEITEIRIWAGRWNGFTPTDGELQWLETTPGHSAGSPEVSLAGNTGSVENLRLTTAYSDVSWDPDDYAVAGTSSTRSFALDADQIRYLDGLEIFGRVTVETADVAPIPEPSTFAIWSLGLLGLGLLSRRRR